MKEVEWVEDVRKCLRRIGEQGRVFPSGKSIELVYTVTAVNYILLRTEGPGDINKAQLPGLGIDVPVIQPQKLMAVVRRRMLQALRMFRDSGAEMKGFVKRAKELGFTKAAEHVEKGWNCTIQPPLAQQGEKLTDIGMDGYCPACTIFGAALTNAQASFVGGAMSLGIKTRVHFDPAFATQSSVIPETHNKVTEGTLSSTGGALFTDIHVVPGTIFIGRATLHDLTEPELLAVLYSIATVEELGGRSGVFGTVKVELAGIRCGDHSLTSALELTERILQEGASSPAQVKGKLRDLLHGMEFKVVTNEDVLSRVKPYNRDCETFRELWESSLDFASQVSSWVKELSSSRRGT